MALVREMHRHTADDLAALRDVEGSRGKAEMSLHADGKLGDRCLK